MTTIKTVLKFDYEPTDLFKAQTAATGKHGHLTLDAGKAVYILEKPIDPIPDALMQELRDEVSGALALRGAIVHKSFRMSGPNITHDQAGGGQNQVITVPTLEIPVPRIQARAVARDAEGNVTGDSEAGREKTEKDLFDAVFPKLGDPTLVKMINSYRSAIRDSADELVHLFEITEAVSAKLGGYHKTLEALKISKSDWDAIDGLANNNCIRQGRHRGEGETQNMRDATREELDKARNLGLRIMKLFADKLP